MKQIIVNADDFGINPKVTEEIERQIIAGRVSSTTVMANGVCLDEVKRFVAEHPDASYGVHLCLTEFDSLTKSVELFRAGLTDEKGTFIKKAIFSSNIVFDNTLLKAIKDELNAQIDVVESLGFAISHADSHHHSHTIYRIKEIFSDVLLERGISKVRVGSDFRTLRMRAHLLLWMQRNKLNKYYRNSFKTTDAFYSYDEFLNAGFPIKDGETIELMCHPGHPGAQYRNEIALIENYHLPQDILLMSYNQL